jgi:hypothetical protein
MGERLAEPPSVMAMYGQSLLFLLVIAIGSYHRQHKRQNASEAKLGLSSGPLCSP